MALPEGKSVAGLARQIAEDAEKDARLDNKPFTGEVVGAQIGGLLAYVYVLAQLIETQAQEIEMLTKLIVGDGTAGEA